MIDLNGAAPQEQASETRLARAALTYVSKIGVPVFPCRARHKTPLTKHGVHDATVDELQIAAWWNKWPDANIGIATGEGVLVLDVDGAEGEETLAALEAVHGPLPVTPEQTTGKGRHLFFHVEVETRNTSRRLGAGLDTRGDGGYVIAAPSIHPSGRRYAWVDGRKPSEIGFAQAPEWLLAGLVRQKPERAAPAGLERPHPGAIPDAWVRGAVDGEFQRVARAAPGSRNATINEAAFRLGQLVGAGVLDEPTAKRTLEAAADACGALADERDKTLGTIARGLAAGFENPRDLSQVGASRVGHNPDRSSTRSEADEPRNDQRSTWEEERAPRDDHGLRGEWLKDISYSAEPELVEGLLPSTGLGFLYGPSSAGKSFIAISWALLIASGNRVLDRPTLASGVLYIAAEGQAGLRKRLVAARRQHDLDDVELPFNYLPAFINLADPDGKEVERVLAYARECSAEMQALGAPLRLIIIDTMAAAAPGVDENTSKDMGPLIFRLQKLAADLGCLVLVVAHVGKDEARGLRGWSGSRAAADTAIECRVERKDPDDRESPVTRRYIWLEKAKDGPCGFTLSDYRLQTVDVGVKPSGQSDTTCWVEYAAPVVATSDATVADDLEAAARARMDALRLQVLDALVDCLGEEWLPRRETADLLKVNGGILIGLNSLEGLLSTFAEGAPSGVHTLQHAAHRIEIKIHRSARKSTMHFRVMSDD